MSWGTSRLYLLLSQRRISNVCRRDKNETEVMIWVSEITRNCDVDVADIKLSIGILKFEPYLGLV